MMKYILLLGCLSMQLSGMDYISKKIKNATKEHKQKKLNKQLHKQVVEVSSIMHKGVASLIEQGAQVNSYRDGTTALHKCVNLRAHDLYHIVELLIKNGADPNLKTEDELKQTVLHYSILNNHIQSVRMLLTNGADVHALDAEGKSPLHCACIAINGIQHIGKTSFTSYAPSDDIIKELLSYGANPVFENEKQHTTALHVMHNQFSVIFEHAQFSPNVQQIEIAEKKKRILMTLFCFKKLKLPTDLQLKILSCLPEFCYCESVIGKLCQSGYDDLIPTMVANRSFQELKQIIPSLKDSNKTAFIDAIVAHRIAGGKKLLAIKNKENQLPESFGITVREIEQLFFSSGEPTPHNQFAEFREHETAFEEQYAKKIRENVYHDLGLKMPSENN